MPSLTHGESVIAGNDFHSDGQMDGRIDGSMDGWMVRV